MSPGNDNPELLKCQGISKKFCKDLKRSLRYAFSDICREFVDRQVNETLRKDEFWSLDDISFSLRKGECLGLIGSNGAGKTTLLRVLSGLLKPDKGRIEIRGRVGGLIALNAGFNPILTARENIYINGGILGITRREVDKRFEEIVDFAELHDALDMPVSSYSSGMQVRLGFSIAVNLIKPDVLLLDEVLAVGDARFQQKCISKVRELISNAAVVFVSHSMPMVSRICNTAILLDKGKQITTGSVESVAAEYNRRNGGDQSKSLEKLDMRLKSADVTSEIPSIQHGNDLTICVSFLLEDSFDDCLFIFALIDETGVTMLQFECILPNASKQGGDRIECRITVESVSLPSGVYYSSWGLYEGSSVIAIGEKDFSVVMVGGPRNVKVYSPKFRIR